MLFLSIVHNLIVIINTIIVVQLAAVMDTSGVSAKNRLYLPLLLELVLESSVIQGGVTELPYETVVRRLSADMVSTSAEMGLSIGKGSTFYCGPFCNYMMIDMRVLCSALP